MHRRVFRWAAWSAAGTLIATILLLPWSSPPTRGAGGRSVEPLRERASLPTSATPMVATLPHATRAGAEREEVPPPESLRASTRPAQQLQDDPVRGRVLLEDHTPAPGTIVRVGGATTETDAGGAFLLEHATGQQLVATLQGHAPAVLAASEWMPARSNLEVVLPGPAATIDGWLVDANGIPCAGWQLELAGSSGTEASALGRPPMLPEDLAAGARERAVGDPGNPVPGHNPNLLRIGPDGAFRVGGLVPDREYVLHAWDEGTMRTAFSPPVAAGTTRFLFIVPDIARRERVDGRTVDRYGSPLAGVRVRLTMRVHQVPGYTSFHTGQEVRTGADGTFEFRQVPCQDLLLRFDGDDVVGDERALLSSDPGAGLQVTMATLCRFRYEARALAATSLRVLDADERPMRLVRQTGPGRSEGGLTFPVESGASPELQASDEAAWLVLEDGARVLQRLPIRLHRGATNVLRD